MLSRTLSRISTIESSEEKILRPPIPWLLHTNDVPTDDEASVVRQAIANVEQNIPYEEDEDDAKPTHAQHHRHRFWPFFCHSSRRHPVLEHRQAFLQQHRAILAPHRKLPPELWMLIFTMYANDTVSTELPLAQPPWILGHICRTWRSIALDTPTLWTRFRLRNIDKNAPRRIVELQPAALSTLLQRSHSHPISFYFEADKDSHITSLLLLKALFEHSERWEAVELVIPEEVCAHFARVKHKLSRLRSLKLALEGYLRLVVDMFEDAPCLEEVFIHKTLVQGRLRLPWAQIKVYTEHSNDLSSLTALLGSSSQVRQIRFAVDERSFNIPTPPSIHSPITLSHLTTLSLEAAASAESAPVDVIISKLTFPALVDLTVRARISRPWFENLLVEALLRSNCTLRRLVYHLPTSFSASNLAKILSMYPNIHDLGLYNPSEEVFKLISLSTGKHQYTFSQHLELLTIHLSDAYYDYSLLRDFAYKRFTKPSVDGQLRVALFTPRLQGCALASQALMVSPSLMRYNMGFLDLVSKRHNQTLLWEHRSQPGQAESNIRTAERAIQMMEEFEMTHHDVEAFYLSDVAASLYSLGLLATSFAAPEKTKHLIDRVNAVVDRWTSVLAYVPFHVSWRWDPAGSGYLYYAPHGSHRAARPKFNRCYDYASCEAASTYTLLW